MTHGWDDELSFSDVVGVIRSVARGVAHFRVTPEKMLDEAGWLKPKSTKRAKAKKK